MAASIAVPGTIGSAAAIVYPNDEIEFLSNFGIATSVRSTQSGALNVGIVTAGPGIRYGDDPVVAIDPAAGDGLVDIERVLVSESPFAVLAEFPSAFAQHQAYYPGVIADDPTRAIVLNELFPELAAIDYRDVLDVSSYQNQLHLLLANDSQLWVYTTADPSLVPEPLTATYVLLAIGLVTPRRKMTAIGSL